MQTETAASRTREHGYKHAMYFLALALFMLILPVGSVVAEASAGAEPVLHLIGKWFAFWGVGVRLGLAGLRQALNPAGAARDVFEVDDPRAQGPVRDLGFANLALAMLGLMALLPGWTAPAALAGALYYALSGWRHAAARERNAERRAATAGDLFVAAVLALYLCVALIQSLQGGDSIP